MALVAPFCENYNRKMIIGFSTVGYGIAQLSISFVKNPRILNVISLLMGLFQALVEQIIFTINGDFFAPNVRQKAIIAFSFLTLFQFPALMQIQPLIHLLGWRNAYAVIGGLQIFLGLLTVITIREPLKHSILAQDVDDDEIDELVRRAENIIARSTDG